jgi:hypothetical protein
MSLSRTLTAAGAAVLLTTALAGCGGSSTLTAKEFKAQANKLCAAAKKDTDKMGATLSENSSNDEVTKAVDGAVARNNQLADDIDALKAPKSLQGDVDAMLKSVRDGLKKLDAATSVKDLQTMDDPFIEANQKSKDLGLAICAQ